MIKTKNDASRTTQLFFLVVTSCYLFCTPLSAQNEWSICKTPPFENRVDDLFMLNNRVGYAVCGDGRITKTTNGGQSWQTLTREPTMYYRSVEFINEQTGFVGGFSMDNRIMNVFRKTTDGGATWTDLTPLIHPLAREGICGLAAADQNTIYGCGNWFRDSAYIIKSSDGGNTWDFIDMHTYASSIIDMHFLNKDTGFATGRSAPPLRTAIILHTVNGGQTWTNRFTDTIALEYCWKIQRVTNQTYAASIEDFGPALPRVLRSTDGGLTWSVQVVSTTISNYNIEGIGFIDSLTGWTGGGLNNSFKTVDGGLTWQLDTVCPLMNRVFKVNDSLLFATGDDIWRFGPANPDTTHTGLRAQQTSYASLSCYPNPAHGELHIQASLKIPTHLLLVLCNSEGKIIREIENSNKQPGTFAHEINTADLAPGSYYVVLKTHEADRVMQVVVR